MDTEKCTYYSVTTHTLHSDEIRASSAGRKFQRIWCAHKHSHVPERAGLGFSGLTCGGDLARCMLTQEQFDDHV